MHVLLQYRLIVILKCRLNYTCLCRGRWVRVVVEPWGLGFWVVLTLTVTLTQTLTTTQTLNDHNPPN